MKNNKKKSPTMKIMSAATMLAVSAAMLGTSTYAWFTMNKDVEVKNLAVKAKAEGGLLISEVKEATGEWDDVANTTVETGTALVALYPTSTANGTVWYHATSKNADEAAEASAGSGSQYKADGYDTLTLSNKQIQAEASGQNGKKDLFYTGSGATEADYYVKYTYYLKTSSEGNLSLGTVAGSQNVMISEVTATASNANSGTSSAELDKALRVGVKFGSNDGFYIFAPFSGATTSYYVNASSSPTTATDSSSSSTTPMTVKTDLGLLPNRTAEGTPVYVYMWYEGEDTNCKSNNIVTSLDDLTVNITFSLGTV